MSDTSTNNSQLGSPDGRKAFWLQQYATAFTNGDKRAAAVALQFVQHYNRVAIRAKSKQDQLA